MSKNDDEVKVARSFVKYGYGLKVLRDEIKDPNMSPTRYNNVITLVIKADFRAIEASIGQSNRIAPVTHVEERILRSPLINCDKWLPSD